MYRSLLFLKLIGLMSIAGGLVASALVRDRAQRRATVMIVVSLGMMAAWIAGYLLTGVIDVSPIELWPLAGVLIPLLAYGALLRSLRHEPGWSLPYALSVSLYMLTVAVMVWRPLWGAW